MALKHDVNFRAVPSVLQDTFLLVVIVSSGWFLHPKGFLKWYKRHSKFLNKKGMKVQELRFIRMMPMRGILAAWTRRAAGGCSGRTKSFRHRTPGVTLETEPNWS